MVFSDRFRNFGMGSSKGGFLGVPGIKARIPRIEEGSLPNISIGTYDGPLDDLRGIERSPGAMRQDLPGRRIDVSGREAEFAQNRARALEARRMGKLNAADPGLSTRGLVGAPGRGGRAVTGGLEARGTSSAGRKRPPPGLKGGTQRGLERRGVRPGPGTRRINPGPKANVGMGTYKGGFNQAFADALRAEDAKAMGAMKAGYNKALGSAIGAREMGTMKAGFNKMFGEALQHGRDAEAFARRTGAGTPRVNRPVPVRSTPPTPTPRTPVVSTGGGTPPGLPRGVDRPVRGALDDVAKQSKRLKGRGLMIGAGAAVIAGLAYSGRRGEGSSGGRTSMGRY